MSQVLVLKANIISNGKICIIWLVNGFSYVCLQQMTYPEVALR